MSDARQEYQWELGSLFIPERIATSALPLRGLNRGNPTSSADFPPERFLLNPILLTVCLIGGLRPCRADDPETRQRAVGETDLGSRWLKKPATQSTRGGRKLGREGAMATLGSEGNRKGKPSTTLMKQGKSSAFTKGNRRILDMFKRDIHRSYQELLKSHEWTSFCSLYREHLEQRYGHDNGWRCHFCDTSARLEVHHRGYKPNRKPWDYEFEDVMVLCSDCHEHLHRMADDLWNEILKLDNQWLMYESRKAITKLIQRSNLKPANE